MSIVFCFLYHYVHDARNVLRMFYFKYRVRRNSNVNSAFCLPYMPTAPSVNGRGKAWLTDGGVVFAEASVSQSNRFAGFFPLLPAFCDARARVASPFLNLHTRSDLMTDP